MTQSVNFDRASDFYDKTRSFPPEVEAQIGSFVVNSGSLKPTDKLLEIGVGTGRIALPVAPHVGQVVGVDISVQMMEQLRRKQNSERVEVTLADALALPFPDTTFDAGLIVHVLHLVSDARQVLQEMARTLKPTAKLLHGNMRFPEQGSIEKLARILGDTSTSGRMTGRYAAIDKLLDEMGWRKLGRHAHEFTRYITPRTYIEQIEQRVWSSTWRLSDDELAEMVKRLYATVDEHFGGNLDALVDSQGAFEVAVYAVPEK